PLAAAPATAPRSAAARPCRPASSTMPSCCDDRIACRPQAIWLTHGPRPGSAGSSALVTEVWLEPPAHPVAAASGEHVRGVLKKLRGCPQQRLPRCPIQLSHRAPSRRIVLSLAAHRRNSSATITGFPHFTAFFALLDCEPASATTSTSVFVLVSVGTA